MMTTMMTNVTDDLYDADAWHWCEHGFSARNIAVLSLVATIVVRLYSIWRQTRLASRYRLQLRQNCVML